VYVLSHYIQPSLTHSRTCALTLKHIGPIRTAAYSISCDETFYKVWSWHNTSAPWKIK